MNIFLQFLRSGIARKKNGTPGTSCTASTAVSLLVELHKIGDATIRTEVRIAGVDTTVSEIFSRSNSEITASFPLAGVDFSWT